MIKKPLLVILGLIVASLSCNLEAAAPTAIDPTLMVLIAGQTVAAVQTQSMLQTQGVQTDGTPMPQDTTSAPPPPGDTPNPPPAATNTPTLTALPSLTETPTPTITLTPIPCNWAKFITDVTIPDDWTTTTNDHFTKTWRVQNIGTCTWTSGYKVKFDHGDAMGAPAEFQITTGTVVSGQSVDITIEMLSPGSEGTYQVWYKLYTPGNEMIPFSNSVNHWFWVKIKVQNPTPTITPTATIPPTGISYPFAQVSVPAGEVGISQADCPSGSVLIGGGYAANSKMIPHTQSKNGNGWRVYAKNNNVSAAILNSYAVCLSGTGGTVTQVTSSVTLSSGNIGHAVANCPAGSIITAGGYASNYDVVRVYNSSKDGDGWKAWAKNNSGSNKTLIVYAICLSGTGASSSQAPLANISIGANSATGGQTSCPAGTFAVGGGFALQEDLAIYNSSPKISPSTQWSGYAHNSSGSPKIMFVYGICLSLP